MIRGSWRRVLADTAPGVSLPVLGLLWGLAVAACDDHDGRFASPSGGSGGAGSPSVGSAGAPDPALAAGAGGSPGAGAGGASVGEAPADAFPTDLLASSALEVLTRRCGGCHAGSESDGGIGAIDDLDALVSSGLVVPGNAAASPLLESIRSGRMPPAGRTLTPVDVGELWLLEGFIDSMGTDPDRCEPVPFLGVDDAYAALLADIAARPEPDRPFIRYVTLIDAPGGYAMPIQLRRDALFTTINGTSLDPEIHLPVPIDAAELIYRLDIRDYDWDRSMDLDDDGSEDHPDGWRALDPTPSSFRDPRLTRSARRPAAPCRCCPATRSCGRRILATCTTR